MKNNIAYLSEKEILRSVRDLLKLEEFFVIRNQAGLGSMPGLADITAIKDGNVLWIETKTQTGVLSIHQKKFQHEIELHKGIYLVIRDVEELIDCLRDMNLCLARLF